MFARSCSTTLIRQGEIYLVHGTWEESILQRIGFQTPNLLRDALNEFHAWLAHPSNSDEVITFIFEHYFGDNTNSLSSYLRASSLGYLVYEHDPTEPWPTLRDMAQNNQRVVLFSSRGLSHGQWDYMVESHYRSPDETTPRGESAPINGRERSLFNMNHFRIGGLPSSAYWGWAADNLPSYIQSHRQAFPDQIPNYLSVDGVGFGNNGGVMEATRVVNAEWRAKRPDLQVRITSLSPSFRPGTNIRVSVEVTNRGQSAAFKLDTSFTLSASGVQPVTGSERIEVVPAGGTVLLQRDIFVPVTYPMIPATVSVVTDANDVVYESNESNNTHSRAIMPQRPDLVPAFITPPRRLVAGGTESLTVEVRNHSSVIAPPATHVVEMQHGGSWVLLAEFRTGSLTAGAGATRTFVVDGPYYLTSSDVPVRFTVDRGGEVSEGSEANSATVQISTVAHYGVSNHVEFRPTWRAGLISNGTHMNLSAGNPERLEILVTPGLSSRYAGDFYLCLLSGSSRFVPDALTDLGLLFVNTPLFENWFGTFPATFESAQLALDLSPIPNVAEAIGLRLHTTVHFFDAQLQAYKGMGTETLATWIER